MILQKKVIEYYEEISFDSTCFAPLVDWCTNTMKEEVVIFKNGNVFLSKAMLSQVESVIQKMLPFSLFPKDIYEANPQIIKEILAATDNSVQTVVALENKSQKLTSAQIDLRDIIVQAIENKVSDVHFEVRKDVCLIRFRELGDMKTIATWSGTRATKLAFVAFNTESDDVKSHFNSLIPHDASMQLDIDNTPIRIRLASIPAYPYPSFDLVLRILGLDSDIRPLEALGYTKTQLSLLHKAVQQKNGAIILAGATGSGKSTTLASMINLIPKHKKVYTIEDPIENKLLNATQIPVNHENNLCTFSHLVRQTMRMDPDCLVIGEIRDEDTARNSARAAITGHIVLATLHANSATNIPMRLLDLGLNINTLADPGFLKLLSYQTLVKKLCSECKQPSKDFYQRDVLESDQIFVQGDNPNCPKCRGKGVVGRMVIAELIKLSGIEFDFIQRQTWYEWHQHSISQKNTVLDQTLNLIKNGTISVQDAESAVGYINMLHPEK